MVEMISVKSLLNKVTQWEKSDENILFFQNVNFEQWVILNFSYIKNSLNLKPIVFVFESETEVDAAHTLLKNFFESHIFPDIEDNPYSTFYQSEFSLFERLKIFGKLINHDKFITLCTIKALMLKICDLEFLQSNRFTIAKDDIISQIELSKKLVSIGYQNAPSVEEPGQFCLKGEIFDIYTSKYGPIRIHYFDELIEHIFAIDPETNKTIKSTSFEKIELEAAPLTLTEEKYRLNLINNLPHFGPSKKELFEKRRDIAKTLSDGNLFENYITYFPLFFKNPKSLFDLNQIFNLIFIDSNKSLQSNDAFKEKIFSQYEFEKEELLLPEPTKFYSLNIEDQLTNIKHIDITFFDKEVNIDNNINYNIDLKIIDFELFIRDKISNQSLLNNHLDKIKNYLFIIGNFSVSGNSVIFFIKNENNKNEIQNLFELLFPENYNLLLEKITFIYLEITKGFYYKNENILFVSDSDIFGKKIKKTKVFKRQNTDLFADQLSTLNKGDFVIHKSFGIGIFEGIETLNFSGQDSDFVTIRYENDDKVFVPVYKLDLIQKYADSISDVKVANLNTSKFNTTKQKAKNSVKKLAFDLLELQAKRKLQKGFSFSPPDELYHDFEKLFPFDETPDQKATIDDVLNDMICEQSMDRLVCGDVGFGKTEIAMRAAFKAVLDKKQVAVLVPTTVLSLQHFNSFKNRFKEFPVNIEFISRFKSRLEEKQIVQNLTEGKIDIIIGTHKLLSEKIKFFDLGLVIVDEEHRFGVAHKEKLKLLKKNVDFLTLTATPIPRTLQLSFLGIRDLSLIKTAPPKRKSIKSYIIKEDKFTIKSAIEREFSRGGQVFIVHNRVKDIEVYASKITELVPSANICIAHGQMSERELESKIKSFYDGKYNILLSTTIIESGIDIANANTMIIDRADTFGLAQLHQLRGRIGRSDKKAYAYFVVPDNKLISNVASKRLQALKKYTDIGSGFSLATSDLEIRGAGDILGAEQSGYIENIGLELYMQLLQEAIQEIKGEAVENKNNVEITTNFPSFIPKKYITDQSSRLRYYKKLSNASTHELLVEIKNDLEDIYGLLPIELINLFKLLTARLNFSKIFVDNIKVSGSIVNIKFNKDTLNKNAAFSDMMVKYFMSFKKRFQLRPDYSVTCSFKESVSLDKLIEFSNELIKELVAS